MNILFVDAFRFRADGLLYQLEKYGYENACVVDFPTQDKLYNGLAFVFRESGSIGDISVIVHHCHTDIRSTDGAFYNDVKNYADADQYVDLTILAPDYICPLGSKVFDTRGSLLEQKDYLERMLISQGAIDRFTAFKAPKEFFQTLKIRRGK
ncbi:MAG: hypothetical protein AAF572_26905 [Cyanobacteria bacterium P01_B01_bin.77]